MDCRLLERAKIRRVPSHRGRENSIKNNTVGQKIVGQTPDTERRGFRRIVSDSFIETSRSPGMEWSGTVARFGSWNLDDRPLDMRHG
jgi:hypothetical protein